MQFVREFEVAAAAVKASQSKIRYARDWATAEKLQHEPLGFEFPMSDGETFPAHITRGIVADYLEDHGRSDEADLARYHEGLLAHHDGKLHRGKYSEQPVLDAMRPVERHLDEWSNYSHWHPYIAVNRGDWNDHFYSELEPNHIHLVHGEGEPDSEEPANEDELEHEEIHFDALPRIIANIVDEHANQQHHRNWGPDHSEPYELDIEGSDQKAIAKLLSDAGHPAADSYVFHRQHPYSHLSSLAHRGQGDPYELEQAADQLESLAEEFDPNSHADRQRAERARELATSLRSTALISQQHEEENQRKFEELLDKLRSTRPVVADLDSK